MPPPIRREREDLIDGNEGAKVWCVSGIPISTLPPPPLPSPSATQKDKVFPSVVFSCSFFHVE